MEDIKMGGDFEFYSELFPSTKGEPIIVEPQLFESARSSLLHDPKPVVTEETFETVQFPIIKRIFS